MPSEVPKRAVFLDRDGTLIVERDYLADPEQVEFVEGSFEALRLLHDHGYQLIVVTNQSGIARGLYSLEDYRAVEARVEQRLAEQGIVLDGVFLCPHHPDYTGPCDCRKPGLGMYRAAERNLRIDLATSVFIGDRVKDVLPALAVGGRGILVLTGYGETQRAALPPEVDVASNLLSAAYSIVGKSRTTP